MSAPDAEGETVLEVLAAGATETDTLAGVLSAHYDVETVEEYGRTRLVLRLPDPPDLNDSETGGEE
jgi:hypothetical protein